MLRAGPVDEVDVDLLPALIGGCGTPALFDAPPLSPGETPVELDLMAAEVTVGGRLRLRYSVRRSAGPPIRRPDDGEPYRPGSWQVPFRPAMSVQRP